LRKDQQFSNRAVNPLCILLIACFHDQNKLAFLKGRLLTSQSEQFKKINLKVPIGWKKASLPKKPVLF